MWWHKVTHWRGSEGGNRWMEWVASTLHTTSEHGVSSITTADAHTSATRGRLNWRPRQFKWTRPFRLKTKSRFCACAITFQTHRHPLDVFLGCTGTLTSCPKCVRTAIKLYLSAEALFRTGIYPKASTFQYRKLNRPELNQKTKGYWQILGRMW